MLLFFLKNGSLYVVSFSFLFLNEKFLNADLWMIYNAINGDSDSENIFHNKQIIVKC